MRLPGTYNLINNDLPSREFLEKYARFKQRQRLLKEGALTDDAKAGGKRTNNGGAKKDAGNKKGGKQDAKDDDDDDDANGGGDFTKAQDEKIIEMKLADGQWKAIAMEVGKEVHHVKERFKIVKPDDFDKKHQEMKNAAHFKIPIADVLPETSAQFLISQHELCICNGTGD